MDRNNAISRCWKWESAPYAPAAMMHWKLERMRKLEGMSRIPVSVGKSTAANRTSRADGRKAGIRGYRKKTERDSKAPAARSMHRL